MQQVHQYQSGRQLLAQPSCRRGSSNLSSSLRVAVLEYFQHLAAGLKPDVLAPAREPER
jgi:predicted DNA-binding ribbon-helix-helix protein